MKRSSKFKCWGICTIISGILLVALGITLPIVLPSLVQMGAKEGAALQESNMDKWAAIPGPLDLGVYK